MQKSYSCTICEGKGLVMDMGEFNVEHRQLCTCPACRGEGCLKLSESMSMDTVLLIIKDIEMKYKNKFQPM
jgi:DnaJ-class molecular chaperone